MPKRIEIGEQRSTWMKGCRGEASRDSIHFGVLRIRSADNVLRCPLGAITMVSRVVVDVEHFQLIEIGEQRSV